MAKLLVNSSIRFKDNKKFVVAIILIISDFICIALSAFTAFQFRFPDRNLEIDSRPAIAQIDYRGILLIVSLSWLFIFIKNQYIFFSF
jgi:hypothetical protein